ncbi:MAG: hypothetical protein EOO61_01785 [Hymenobacter sp.]|nr:MAG: hypothetical protein EOO61_01785 [Hymenobacter sp.]
MQKAFKQMAERHYQFPNVQFVCRFMHLNLLNHAQFTPYLMTPAALKISSMSLCQTQSHQLLVNTTLSATCLLSEGEFIRFTIKGHIAAGIWVRNASPKQSSKAQMRLPFNIDLHHDFGNEALQLKLFGDTLASETQRLLIQIIMLLELNKSIIN